MFVLKEQGHEFPRPVIYGPLDENIIGLVMVLNHLPGIATVGSCGGHQHPGQTQQEAGHWFVTFDCLAAEGLPALDILHRAVSACPGAFLEMDKGGENSCGIISGTISGSKKTPTTLANRIMLEAPKAASPNESTGPLLPGV